MNILDKIYQHKIYEVAKLKTQLSIEELKEKSSDFTVQRSLSSNLAIQSSVNIIAEFKRKSPSKDQINISNSSPTDVGAAYTQAKVAGISVLTDSHFFGALTTDILDIRKVTDLPILRKEFIVDPYQIYESKAIGVDAILLIAAMVDTKKLSEFTEIAQSCGLEVLCEIHEASEIKKVPSNVDIIGVNNRNLKSFEVNFNNSIQLKSKLPDNKICISESGISKPETIIKLKEVGFDGFLIGEAFMKTKNPGATCHTFINTCNNLLKQKNGS